jgi:XTP/dITP diphosphohydrolase
MPRLVLATRHEGEIAELRTLLTPLGWEGVHPGETAAATVAYNQGGSTHRDQAVNRARAFAEAAGMPALALATALQVYALDQQPGVRTHDYAGEAATDADHRAKLLAAMQRVPPGQRIALFQATLALAVPGEERVRATSSTLECEITTEERGTGGHLYDSVTQLQDRKTLAEHDEADRNQKSHRGMAMNQMKRHLAELAARQA